MRQKMKTLVLGVYLFGTLLIQGCAVYAEPAGGYYYRGGFWYYKDVHGTEFRENHRYHHPPEQHPEDHHDDAHHDVH
jgi:hypothetical protein